MGDEMKYKAVKIVGAVVALMSLSQCLLDGDYKMFDDNYGNEGSSAVSATVLADQAYMPDAGAGEVVLDTGI